MLNISPIIGDSAPGPRRPLVYFVRAEPDPHVPLPGQRPGYALTKYTGRFLVLQYPKAFVFNFHRTKLAQIRHWLPVPFEGLESVRKDLSFLNSLALNPEHGMCAGEQRAKDLPKRQSTASFYRMVAFTNQSHQATYDCVWVSFSNGTDVLAVVNPEPVNGKERTLENEQSLRKAYARSFARCSLALRPGSG